MTIFARFAEENRNLTINEAALVWSAITKERERCMGAVIAHSGGLHCCSVDDEDRVVEQAPQCHCWRSKILEQIRSED